MKKAITSIVLLITLQLSAQNKLVIDSIVPNTVCFNDTVTCYIHSIGTCTQCEFFTIQTVPQNLTVYTDNSVSQQATQDSGFVFKMRITHNFNVGNQQLFFPGGHSNGTNYTLIVNNCIASIEKTNQIEDLISTEYYNLLGEKISEPNGLTIEIKTYANGEKEVRKIITSAQ